MKLITALPRTGKTTIIMKLIEILGRDNCIGFYSEEIISDNERVGFQVVTLNGRCEVFAHVDLNSEIKCGRYGVDIAVLEDVLAGELEKAIADTSGKLIVIDEIGPMQIFSEKFKKQLLLLADSGKKVIGTTFYESNPWIDEFKQREDIEIIQLTMENREYLLNDFVAQIGR